MGSHRVRIELTGPDGIVVREKRLVATDPDSDFEVLGLVPIEEIWPEAQAISAEGIALDMYGGYLWVANYPTGEVVRVDARSLEPDAEHRFHLAPGVEGLAVTPSALRLVAIHKHDLLSVVSIHEGSLSWAETGFGGFFVRILDESHALVSGLPLAVVNLDERVVEHAAAPFQARHFALDRSRARLVVSNLSNRTVDILGLPELSTLRSIPLDGLYATQVAFDPHEDKAYALAKDDAGQSWLFVLQPSTGDRLAKVFVGPGACSGYCVANPVATFGAGRYVAFEQSSSVLVVDTETDLPRYRFGSPPVGVVGGPAGVAALPDSDVLYVLGGPHEALMKIRLRGSAGL